MLSRLVITFLPRSKCLLISCLQSPSVVNLEPPKNKVCHCFPIYLPWNDGTRCHDLSFLNVELYTYMWASWVAQLVKNLPQCRRTWFVSWVGKFPLKSDRLPTSIFLGFPGGSYGRESVCILQIVCKESLQKCGRPGFDSWVGKIPWRRAWQPTPVFLPGESPWKRSLEGYSLKGSQRIWHDWVTKHSTFTKIDHF